MILQYCAENPSQLTIAGAVQGANGACLGAHGAPATGVPDARNLRGGVERERRGAQGPHPLTMIADRLANRSVDDRVPARVRQALEYLRTTDMAAIPPGRHELDGDRLFALVQEYTTRPADECVWEAHRKYIDIQYVVRGAERIGHHARAQAVEREPYDPVRDVALFEPGASYVTVTAGGFAIFGPEDVHSPGVALGDPATVRKVVVKCLV
jgi:biofilm protein TabA